MAKFEKLDAQKQIRGLAEAARQIQIEELKRIVFGQDAESSDQAIEQQNQAVGVGGS